MRKAGKQEQTHSSSNHPLGLLGCFGEIQQQSMLPVHGPQLGANDRKVDVFEVLDRLEIDDDRVLNKQIESMTTDWAAPRRVRWYSVE